MITFFGLIIFTTIVGIGQPQQPQVNVKEVSLSKLLESQSSTFTAYGMGQGSNTDQIYQQAKQQSYGMLSGMAFGYDYEFQKTEDSFKTRLITKGDLDAPKKTDEIFLGSDPIRILLTYQLEHKRPDYPKNSFAYQYTITNTNPGMFTTQVGRSVSKSISAFSELKSDHSFDSGKIWIHNIDVSKKRRSSDLNITVTMIISTD